MLEARSGRNLPVRLRQVEENKLLISSGDSLILGLDGGDCLFLMQAAWESYLRLVVPTCTMYRHDYKQRRSP